MSYLKNSVILKQGGNWHLWFSWSTILTFSSNISYTIKRTKEYILKDNLTRFYNDKVLLKERN